MRIGADATPREQFWMFFRAPKIIDLLESTERFEKSLDWGMLILRAWALGQAFVLFWLLPRIVDTDVRLHPVAARAWPWLLAVYAVYCVAPLHLICQGKESLFSCSTQIVVDSIFVGFVSWSTARITSGAYILFLIPILLAVQVYEDPKRFFPALSAIGAVFLLASVLLFLRPGEQLPDIRVLGSSEVVSFGIVLVHRLTALVVLAAVMRYYRISLLAERRQVSAISDGLQCGVSVLDRQGNVVFMNKKQEAEYAPLGKRENREAREGMASRGDTPDPHSRKCYRKYHRLDRACTWCKLPWRNGEVCGRSFSGISTSCCR